MIESKWNKESLANAMTYMVQDILDDIAKGDHFYFDETEKEFLRLLTDFEQIVKEK